MVIFDDFPKKSPTVETHKSLQKNVQKTVTIKKFLITDRWFIWKVIKNHQKSVTILKFRNDLWVSTVYS